MIKAKFGISESDLGFNDLVTELTDPESDHVAVGVMGTSGSDLLNIAVWNEFGTKNIPERPFMRQTFDRQRGELEKIAKELAAQVFDGHIGKKEALEQLGDRFRAMMRAAIKNREFKPNAPATIRQKGSDLPLVDTGRLQQSFEVEVRRK